MNVLKELPKEFRKPIVIKHGRDGWKKDKYTRAKESRDVEIQLRDKYQYIPTDRSKPTTVVRIKARTNKLIDPLINRYEELDNELIGHITAWIRSGRYKKIPLVLTDFGDWANGCVIGRAGRICRKHFSTTHGRVRISEYDETVILEWQRLFNRI